MKLRYSTSIYFAISLLVYQFVFAKPLGESIIYAAVSAVCWLAGCRMVDEWRRR